VRCDDVAAVRTLSFCGEQDKSAPVLWVGPRATICPSSPPPVAVTVTRDPNVNARSLAVEIITTPHLNDISCSSTDQRGETHSGQRRGNRRGDATIRRDIFPPAAHQVSSSCAPQTKFRTLSIEDGAGSARARGLPLHP
jgi:hypothetical protein